MDSIENLRFDERGLIPVIVQDIDSKKVLMLAYTNLEAFQLTIETGEAHFWSRKRMEIWHKGATSGNTQKVLKIYIDCDADTLLFLVDSRGPACHTGNTTCFFREVKENKFS